MGAAGTRACQSGLQPRHHAKSHPGQMCIHLPLFRRCPHAAQVRPFTSFIALLTGLRALAPSLTGRAGMGGVASAGGAVPSATPPLLLLAAMLPL